VVRIDELYGFGKHVNQFHGLGDNGHSRIGAWKFEASRLDRFPGGWRQSTGVEVYPGQWPNLVTPPSISRQCGVSVHGASSSTKPVFHSSMLRFNPLVETSRPSP